MKLETGKRVTDQRKENRFSKRPTMWNRFMKHRLHFLGLVSTAMVLIAHTGEAVAGERPNIVLLLADDLGYGDLSCFGSPAVKTPHLDRLAKEGMMCTRFYAGSAVCSPTRASVLTGRYPLRFGITKHSLTGINGCPSRLRQLPNS
jgi:hypothetical protein